MKQLIQAGLLANLLISTSSFALNPVNGFYVGLMAEGSSGPSSRHITFREDNELFTGRVNNSRLGGGGGGMLGYRFENFRIEGEGLYNWNGAGTLSIDNCTLQSPNVQTPTGSCPQDHFQAKELGFRGSTSAMYGLVNAYWDFINYNNDTGVFPYLGIGVGAVKVKASGDFINTNLQTSHGQSISNTASAGQGILGVGMFMDDFAWLGMDYRYLTTSTLKDIENKRYTLNTINFSVGLAFDKTAN